MYRRRYYRSKFGKYSNETCCINAIATAHVAGGATFPTSANPNPQLGEIAKGVLVVPATSMLGNRKVKNFTIKLNAVGNESTIVGALVYVPDGTEPSNLSTQVASQSLYEPNQNVICTFLIPPSCTRDANGDLNQVFTPPAITVSTRLARNLSSGDTIVMVFSPIDDLNAGDGMANDPPPMTISGTVNFAIKY